MARLGHPVVRARCAPVPPGEARGADFLRFLDDMADTMRDYQGVGLAANQVHVGRRAAVIEVRSEASRARAVGEVPLTVLINPEIVERSAELVDGWEGCLSVPGFRGLVPRHRRVRLRALGLNGEPLDIQAEDFFARIIQHECDHLDGKVYLDRMPELSTLSFTEEFERYGER